MNATVLAFLVLYYLVVLGIGFWAMRRGAGEGLEGYLLGGREVGPLVTALTLQSTSMSGYMFLGAGSLALYHRLLVALVRGRGYWWGSSQPLHYRTPDAQAVSDHGLAYRD